MSRALSIAVIVAGAVLVVGPVLAQDFNLEPSNPIRGVQDLDDVISAVSQNLLGIAIPIAVLMYTYAGILYITAGAKPDNVKKAKDVLLYTSIGLAIILIGGGFVDLIRSVLQLGQ